MSKISFDFLTTRPYNQFIINISYHKKDKINILLKVAFGLGLNNVYLKKNIHLTIFNHLFLKVI